MYGFIQARVLRWNLERRLPEKRVQGNRADHHKYQHIEIESVITGGFLWHI